MARMLRFFSLLLLSTAVLAQTPITATVVVYRPGKTNDITFAQPHAGIYLDEAKLATVTQGHQVTFAVPAGTHVFRGSEVHYGLKITLVPGQTYYLRMSVPWPATMHLKVELAAPQEATYELQKAAPLPVKRLTPAGTKLVVK